MSHELSSKLGGLKRALTTLLNARLVGMIDQLISSTRAFFHSCEIGAPLMVVRGDGSLVSAEFAALKPIETILSGPAASLVGAHFLTKIENALVCDVGGTTTDIGLLHNGRARLTVEGAVVGGLNTSVEGVSMHTYGLGSDSDIYLSDTLNPSLAFGPRRIVPLSLVDPSQIEHVARVLHKQIAQDIPHRVEGRFVQRTGLEDRFATGLSPIEESLYTKITMQLNPLTDVISSASELSALERLTGRGLVFICGFTPTDAQHILGHQTNGNKLLAELGGILFARKRDGHGRAICSSEIKLAHWVVSQLENRSVEFILQTAFYEDGLDGETLVRSPLLQKALTDSSGIAQLSVSLDRPIIALGASAQLIYPNVGQKLKSQVIVPEYAHVANAIGAVVGEVRFKVVADIQKHRDQFIVLMGEIRTIFESEQEAVDHACATASHYALERAQQVGATHPYVSVEKEIKMVEIEGIPTFISAQIWATAHGRPNMSV